MWGCSKGERGWRRRWLWTDFPEKYTTWGWSGCFDGRLRRSVYWWHFSRLSWCGEGVFQVALCGAVSYHGKTFKNLIIIGIYIKGRHESVHVVVGSFLVADICIFFTDLVPFRSIVGKVEEFLAPESLDLADVSRIPMAFIGVCLPTVVIVLCTCRP